MYVYMYAFCVYLASQCTSILSCKKMFSVDSLNFTRSSLFVFYSFVFVRTISFLLSALFRYFVIVSVLCPPSVIGVLIQCVFFVASSLYRSSILFLSVGLCKNLLSPLPFSSVFIVQLDYVCLCLYNTS